MAMDLNAKAAYIRGLMTGMEFDADSKNGKVIAAMMDLLEEMAATVTEHDDALDQVYDELETLDQDLDDVVSDIYGDDEEDDDEDEEEEDHGALYEVTCPNCGETVYVSEDDLDAGEANCAHCGVTFEVALEGDGEEDAEDGPVQYEVTCPACGATSVVDEEALLDGDPVCPSCGKPLDFEVTEE